MFTVITLLLLGKLDLKYSFSDQSFTVILIYFKSSSWERAGVDIDPGLNGAGLTSGHFLQVCFDHSNELWVLAEASVMKRIVAQSVNSLNIGAAL